MLMGGVSSVDSCHNRSRFVFFWRVASPLLLIVLAACAECAQQNPPPAPPKIDPKAQALLDRTIQALGGPAFLQFKTMTTQGRFFSIQEGMTAGTAPFESAVEFPDKRRYRYGDKSKKPVILVNDGDRAWELDKMGLTSQPAEQLRRWKLSIRFGLENLLRLRIHEAGVLVQAGGTDFVDNVAVQAINIFDPQGVQITLLLNRQTNLPARISYRVQDPATLEWEEYSDIYGDYQRFQGVNTPMHISRSVNGERVSETIRNKVQYDEVYPEGYFGQPH
jgi:hypothetical protein